MYNKGVNSNATLYTGNENTHTRTIEPSYSYHMGSNNEIINQTRNILNRSKGYEESKLNKTIEVDCYRPDSRNIIEENSYKPEIRQAIPDIDSYKPDMSMEYLERIAFMENELRLKDQKTQELSEEIQCLHLDNSKLNQCLQFEIEKNDHLVEDKNRAISRSNQDYTQLKDNYELLEREFNYLEYQFKRSEEIRIEQSILIKGLQKELDIIRSSGEEKALERVKTAEYADNEGRKKRKPTSIDKNVKKITKKKSTTNKIVKRPLSPAKGIIKTKK
jgi:hypothetical protein